MKKLFLLPLALLLSGCDYGRQTLYAVQSVDCHGSGRDGAESNPEKETQYFSSFDEASKDASAMKLACDGVAFAQLISDGGQIETFQYFDWRNPKADQSGK